MEPQLISTMEILAITASPETSSVVPPFDPSYTKIKMGAVGRIKSYCIYRGLGFIIPEEGLLQQVGSPDGATGYSDVMFDQKHLDPEASRCAGLEHGKLRKVVPLKAGQMVQFDVYRKLSGGLVASGVKGVNGGALMIDEEWIIKTDRKEMSREIAKLQAQLKKWEEQSKNVSVVVNRNDHVVGSEHPGLCVICRVSPAVMMYLPCKHLATCKACRDSASHSEGSSSVLHTCMVCRHPGASLTQIYLP